MSFVILGSKIRKRKILNNISLLPQGFVLWLDLYILSDSLLLYWYNSEQWFCLRRFSRRLLMALVAVSLSWACILKETEEVLADGNLMYKYCKECTHIVKYAENRMFFVSSYTLTFLLHSKLDASTTVFEYIWIWILQDRIPYL